MAYLLFEKPLKPKWSSIIGWEGLYQINTDGVVYSVRRRRVVTPKDNGEGYKFVHLWLKRKSHKHYIHRLVMLTFCGVHDDPEYDEVEHDNNNRGDNRLANLAWTTSKLNVADRVFRRYGRRQEKVPF